MASPLLSASGALVLASGSLSLGLEGEGSGMALPLLSGALSLTEFKSLPRVSEPVGVETSI